VLVGTDAGNVAVVSSATHAFPQVASALDYGERPAVVVSDMEFSRATQFWRVQGERGARVDRPDGRRGCSRN
jgi:hypothetical protein